MVLNFIKTKTQEEIKMNIFENLVYHHHSEQYNHHLNNLKTATSYLNHPTSSNPGMFSLG